MGVLVDDVGRWISRLQFGGRMGLRANYASNFMDDVFDVEGRMKRKPKPKPLRSLVKAPPTVILRDKKREKSKRQCREKNK